MSSKQKKSVLNGITVLGISGLICKMIGVLYRIPLAWLIGAEGLGLYQLVFPSYAMLLTISSAGIPVAISKMISYSLAEKDIDNAKRVFKIALYILIVIGFISTILMVVGSDWLSRRVGEPNTNFGFIAIAPSLLIVCIMSAFRGYMQGLSDMKPTAISQLVEQIGKVVIALPLAFAFSKYGVKYAAAGALLGTSLAEFSALLYIYIKYSKTKHEIDKYENSNINKPLQGKVVAKKILELAIPITIGACVVPLSGFVDSAMLVNRMCSIGISQKMACSIYGLYSGLVITLINVPTAIAIAISMSLVPAISSAVATNNFDLIKRQSGLGIRYAFLIGLPFSVGMSVLAKPILHFFYSSLGETSVNAASGLLEISSFTIILFTVVQATSGILQGLHKQKIPMYTLAIGVAFKIILNYVLVGIPKINIYGAPISSIVCYTISMLPNLYYVRKYAKLSFDYSNNIIRPSIASFAMGASLIVLKNILPYGRIWTLIMILLAFIIFFTTAILVKTISKEDLDMIKNRRK